MMFYKEADFQDTPIGKIPQDWEIRQIKDVIVSCQNGIWGNDPSPSDKSYPVIRSTEITHDGKIDLSNVAFRKIPEERVDEYCLQNGDILIVGSSGSARLIGRVALFLFSRNEKYLFSNFMIRIRPKGVDSSFLYYFLSSERYLGFIKSLQQTSTGLRNLPKKDFLQIRVPFPPFSEQQKIVGVLGVVDLAVAKAGGVIAKTERLKKGLMQTLLTRGIGHKEYKQTPIGTVPKEWDIKRLEEASMEVTIGVVNPATPYYTSANDGVPYFRSQNVRENRLEPTNVYVRHDFNKRHPRSILKENDTLTLQTGFIGVSCLVPKGYEGANCHSLLITRTNPKMLNPRFLCQFLNSAVGKKIINRHNSGWGRAHLLLEDFRRINIPLPSLQEQQTIAEILSTIDKKTDLEKREKTRLERIKRGLMDLLLTGRVRVKVD